MWVKANTRTPDSGAERDSAILLSGKFHPQADLDLAKDIAFDIDPRIDLGHHESLTTTLDHTPICDKGHLLVDSQAGSEGKFAWLLDELSETALARDAYARFVNGDLQPSSRKSSAEDQFPRGARDICEASGPR